MLQKGPKFNHVLVNNVARLQKSLNLKFEKNENSLPTACTCCWQRAIFANSTIRLLGKKALRQQRGSPIGEGLLPLPTANGEAVGERRCFANSFSFPTAFLLGKNPSPTAELCHQFLNFELLAKISFPTAEFSCWERVSSPTALVLAVGKDLGCW
jgi:hypothetical protein